MLSHCSKPHRLLLLSSLLRSQSNRFSSLALNPSPDPSNGDASHLQPPSQESVLYVLKKLDKKPHKALEFLSCISEKHSFNPNAPTRNLMLRILGRKDHLKDFWVFLRSMTSDGYSIDQGTYLTLLASFKQQKLPAECSALAKFYKDVGLKTELQNSVNGVAKAIVDADVWDDEVERRLEDLGVSWSEDLVVRVLREVRNHPLKALSFFRWVIGRQDFNHGSAAYNAVARVLGRQESIEEFWSLVDEMKKKGLDMDIDTYIKLSRYFKKSKMMKDAVELYEFMMDGPYKPAIQDCGMLLRQISLSGSVDLELVYRVVRKYEAAGYSLSKVVYDGIHRCLTSTGQFDEADEILRKMKQEGFEPDNITYSQLVYGLCKAKRLEEACKVLDEMEECGCVPDVKTWTILIQGHCSAGQVEKALECMTKMIAKGCNADADLMDVLVKGLCGENKEDGAYTLIVEMVERARVRPWQATYKYLIHELLNKRKLEEGLEILRMMKSHNFPPFADPFPSYISKFGTVGDAEEFLKALTVNNFPSSAAYLNVFKSFFKEGRYPEAQDLLFKCPHHIRKHADICELFGSIKVDNAA
ncbi:TPR-like protein [Dioscorea alata]|uniref:TPR-like protein n=1 Tax=Dioscorea alata TaxID=55571 RepID=A0ACB7VA93_DIOAL|nr:TPR-like protein [Dioscorea alata]